MKNAILRKVIDKSSFSERRLIIYLMCKRGKVGSIIRNPRGGFSMRLEALISLIEKGVIKIVDFNDKVVFFRFTNDFEFKKISVKSGKSYKNV
jgi:hypothetical protein